MNLHDQNGFALPSVIIASIVMFIVLLTGLTSMASTSVALDRLYLDKLSTEAEQSGKSMAAACLNANGGVPRWANGSPLRPNTDCAGVNLVTCNNNSSDDSKCYITKNGSLKSRFAVTYTLDSLGKIENIEVNAIVEKVRKTTEVPIDRFQQTSKLNISKSQSF